MHDGHENSESLVVEVAETRRGTEAIYRASMPSATVHSATGVILDEPHNKLFEVDAHIYCMDDIDPDMMMIAAGVVLSLVALLGIYPLWRNARE